MDAFDIEHEYDRVMPNHLDPDQIERHETTRPVAAIARRFVLDARIPATVPGFDAPFFQAGLAGYSDGAMRLIARRHGCPYCITEALLDRTLINGGKGRQREDPDLLDEECGTGDPTENRPVRARLSHPASLPEARPQRDSSRGEHHTTRRGTLDDHPIAGQIMGTNAEDMAAGASLLVDMGYDVIDVNLACPVKKVRKRNRGGHFLAHPPDAINILRAVRQAVPHSIPTTVKLRRAWDETPEMAANFECIFNAAYELGYAWATVHCRTVEQKYNGPGRWAFLAELVQRYPDRVIFGSGDVWHVDDVFAMLEITGVKAVSVARGCIGNPWIFRQARQLMAGEPASPPALEEQRNALLEHFELSVVLHGERAASRMMRKFGIKFSVHHPRPDEVKADFVRCRTVAEWHSVIDRWYAPQDIQSTAPRSEHASPNTEFASATHATQSANEQVDPTKR